MRVKTKAPAYPSRALIEMMELATAPDEVFDDPAPPPPAPPPVQQQPEPPAPVNAAEIAKVQALQLWLNSKQITPKQCRHLRQNLWLLDHPQVLEQATQQAIREAHETPEFFARVEEIFLDILEQQ